MTRPKIGLALGSGATRGFSHIGVIRVLQQHNIPIDFVCGSSIGSVIGAFYCLEISLDKMVKILKYMKSKNLLDFSISKKGVLLGNKIEELLKLFIKEKTFEDLKTPLSIVATDLIRAKRAIFDKGSILKPMRGSISIPGIFTPVEYQDKVLVDGGLVDRLPVEVTRNMGADIVIGVDVGFRPGEDYVPQNMFDIIIQSIGIMEMQALKNNVQKCDVLINPRVQNICPYSLENIDECVEQGMIAMKDKIKRVQEMINQNRYNQPNVFEFYKQKEDLFLQNK